MEHSKRSSPTDIWVQYLELTAELQNWMAAYYEKAQSYQPLWEGEEKKVKEWAKQVSWINSEKNSVEEEWAGKEGTSSQPDTENLLQKATSTLPNNNSQSDSIIPAI